MRSSLVLAMLAFGCTGNALKIDNSGQSFDPGPSNVDLSTRTPQLGDLAISVDLSTFNEPPPPRGGCADLIACTNACTTTACSTTCHKMATAHANALNKTLDDCINAHCVTAPDGGSGPCSGTDQTACNTCVMNTQSGKSPTGMTNGICTPTNDPVCGFCVDPLIACANDMTM
jgi:hypothetical protein